MLQGGGLDECRGAPALAVRQRREHVAAVTDEDARQRIVGRVGRLRDARRGGVRLDVLDSTTTTFFTPPPLFGLAALAVLPSTFLSFSSSLCLRSDSASLTESTDRLVFRSQKVFDWTV